ncbi:MAG TPA: pyrroline-5-carboxylate reductase [Oleiagrimonas sp.]|nr:pyrroline-5-carboxylate reductase [Oleiagrimonas sp.]
MSIGFIGTGALTAAIVSGLQTLAEGPASVMLSPRNAQIAAELAARFPDVRIAEDNQAVLDQCDTIVLAVRPQVADAVLPALRFRKDHHVITLIGILSREAVADMVAPAEHVTKALPMPMIAHGLGATLVCPPDPHTSALFGRLGKVIEVDDAAQFDALSTATASFATYFRYIDTMQTWLRRHDVPDATARDYLSGLFKALATAPEKAPNADFEQLASEYATRGGINEQMVRELADQGVFERVAQGLEAVHARITRNA